MAESRREQLAKLRAGVDTARSRVSAARSAAFEVLMVVEAGRGHSDELLHGRALRGLAAADKNLATALVLGVLRWQIALDARIRPLLQRPDTKLAAPVAIALRMGAFQLLHMDRIPAHAALSESVELAREGGHPHAAGMVNAVLRKIAAKPAAGKKLHESTAAFAERLGHPAWMVERWVSAYGREAALAICEAGQKEPGCGALFAPEPDDAAMPMMDDGSRLVAELAAASAPDAQRVWDCCAAPGGKTLVLAKRLPAAELLATDVSPRRLKALAERMEPVAAVKTVETDAAQLAAEHGDFDLVLCDVPCTGTGTLARNPEIRHRLQPVEFARQAQRQAEILAACAGRLRPGATLVYSTCSLEPEENERVVDAALGTRIASGELHRVQVQKTLSALRDRGRFRADVDVDGLVRGDVLRTLPGVGFEGDGFYAAVFARGG